MRPAEAEAEPDLTLITRAARVVRLVRLVTRGGLVRTRMAGIRAARGEVLTFLDSHVECGIGWLEPLLHRIK